MLILVFAGFVCAEVQYPISELGNCASQDACEIYCDSVENLEVCLSYAETNNLMSDAEIAEARKFMPFLQAGTTPGNCKSEDECDAYCDDENNLIECVDFAVTVGIMTSEEAKMVKKTGGKGPGGCHGEEECDTYCKNKENLQTCVEFSVQNGFMSNEEAERVLKSGGESPGGCQNKEECDAYCDSEEGRMVCLEFSYEHGMISEEEYTKIKEGGEKNMVWSGPGGCTTEEECKEYCDAKGHFQECLDSSFENGFISQEEYDQQMANWEEATGSGNEPGDEYAETPGNYEPGDVVGGEPGDEEFGSENGEEQYGQNPEGSEIDTGNSEPPSEENMAPGDAPGGEVAGSAPAESGGDAGITGEVINSGDYGNSILNKILNAFR